MVVLAATLWTGMAMAQPAGLSAQVKGLIEQLDSAAGEDKKLAAEWELLRLGPEALAYFPSADKLSVSLKERLAPIRAALEELRPRTLTIDKSSMPLSKALAWLARETGMTVVDRRQADRDQPVTLDYQGATFWQVAEDLASQVRASLNLYQVDGQLALVDAPYRPLPRSQHGPFRTTIKRYGVTRDLDAGTHVLGIGLELSWEPRLMPLYVDSGPVSLRTGQDERGQPFLAQLPSRSPVRMAGALAHEFDLLFPAPPRKTQRIDELKGHFVVATPSRMMTFAFKKLAPLNQPQPAFSQSRDGVKVTISKIVEQKDRWIVEVVTENPKAGPRLESHQAAWWLDNVRVQLEQGAGELLKVFTPEALLEQRLSVTATEATVRYHFLMRSAPEQPAAPLNQWRLVCRTPGRMVEVTVPYTFKDVELP
jgi:hypothetical protein